MSTRLFDVGRQKFAEDANWTTDTIKALMINVSTAATMVKAITGATNATPIVITATSHGFANGDIVVIYNVGGNTAANGTWVVAGQTTNTFQLTTVKDALNSTGNAAYTSGGTAVNLTSAANLGQLNSGAVGAAVALSSLTDTNGVLNAANPTFNSVSGTVGALLIYKDTGSAGTSPPLIWVDGQMQVICAATAASSATSIAVERLAGGIPNSTALVFSNGITATLTATANAGDRTLTVSALSGGIAVGHTADVQTTNSGLPFTASGGSYTFQWDTGPNKIAKL